MKLGTILGKSLNGKNLTRDEIMALLSLSNTKDLNRVFAAARSVRQKYFQNKVFLYGFVYFSTFCKNNCSFCYYRNTNNESPRYRKSISETVKIAGELASSGVHLIDLTMGEDPFYHHGEQYHQLTQLVKAVKETTLLPVMISPGLLPTAALYKLKEAGADWYALYQETHNRDLYSRLRLEQGYEERMTSKLASRKMGFLIEEGILLGAGENMSDICHSILSMKEMKVHQARVMSLVPQKGTPLAGQPSPPRIKELITIAVMRLVLGDVLIPASLDIEGITGLKNRLEAGANVVTSIIPPNTGLAGVSQSYLDIEEGFRTVAGVRQVISGLDLKVASRHEYTEFLQKLRQNFRCKGGIGDEAGGCRRSSAGH